MSSDISEPAGAPSTPTDAQAWLAFLAGVMEQAAYELQEHGHDKRVRARVRDSLQRWSKRVMAALRSG